MSDIITGPPVVRAITDVLNEIERLRAINAELLAALAAIKADTATWFELVPEIRRLADAALAKAKQHT